VVRGRLKSRKRLWLSFDEWNVWYRDTRGDGKRQEAPPLLEEVYNLEDALLVGGILNSLLRHAARVRVACLAQLVNVIAAGHRGQVVKMLGDGVFFHFADPADAVRGSLEIVESVGPSGLPPAHVGVNAGPMIYEEGDYFGRAVNIAARIASKAGAGQVLVGEDAYRELAPDGFRLIEQGRLELKGIAQPVRIYEAVRVEPEAD
jgi:class 3 adenylate cyclase